MLRLKIRVPSEQLKARGDTVMPGKRAHDDLVPAWHGELASGQGGQRLIAGAVSGGIAAEERLGVRVGHRQCRDTRGIADAQGGEEGYRKPVLVPVYLLRQAADQPAK